MLYKKKLKMFYSPLRNKTHYKMLVLDSNYTSCIQQVLYTLYNLCSRSHSLVPMEHSTEQVLPQNCRYWRMQLECSPRQNVLAM